MGRNAVSLVRGTKCSINLMDLTVRLLKGDKAIGCRRLVYSRSPPPLYRSSCCWVDLVPSACKCVRVDFARDIPAFVVARYFSSALPRALSGTALLVPIGLLRDPIRLLDMLRGRWPTTTAAPRATRATVAAIVDTEASTRRGVHVQFVVCGCALFRLPPVRALVVHTWLCDASSEMIATNPCGRWRKPIASVVQGWKLTMYSTFSLRGHTEAKTSLSFVSTWSWTPPNVPRRVALDV